MNTNTKLHLQRFISQVENLTNAVLLTIGMETASEIIEVSEELKRALDEDKTITESK